ncbi:MULTISPECIES: T3SS effector HopA1 family protein [unclassified Streptomyces]|uniref:T3SS effector HopA1 family protein n=1 Tax=unclassified Streptomyces TaxID=2593676 RepID=UPI002F9194CB
MTPQLSAGLASLLASVAVAPGGTTATVADRTVRARTPAGLERELGTALYETFHTGHPWTAGARPPLALQDTALVAALSNEIPHLRVERTVPLAQQASGSPRARPVPPAALRPGVASHDLVVSLDGVRVRCPGRRVTPDWGVGTARVELTPERASLSPGFFSVLGTCEPTPGKPLLRVYVHPADSRAAVPLWGRVLRRLEDSQAAYQAKVLSLPSAHPRRDGLVVYLGHGSWHHCHDVAEALQNQSDTAAGTSVFARRLAPGVAIAWEPDDARPQMRGLSFGQHRAAVLARALVRAGQRHLSPARAAEALREARIDPLAPYRNTGSPREDTTNVSGGGS